jgi:hypothetical protein
MIPSIGRQFGRDCGRISPLVFFLLAVCLSSCRPGASERAEALDFASLLKAKLPEAEDLLIREHKAANTLKITLDEAIPEDDSVKTADGAQNVPVAKKKLMTGTSDFKVIVDGVVDELAEIRQQRLDLQGLFKNDKYRGPMVNAVQRDAFAMLGDEITQDDNWILYVRNIQHRADLGRAKLAPEYDFLIRELGVFVLQVDEPPLGIQLQDLREEFGFTDNEIPQWKGAK